MTESGYCVTLSEPPKGGESNGSELFRASAVCSLCCLTGCIRLSTFLAQLPRQTRDNREEAPRGNRDDKAQSRSAEVSALRLSFYITPFRSGTVPIIIIIR